MGLIKAEREEEGDKGKESQRRNMNKIALANNKLVVIGGKENGCALRIPQG